MLEVESVEPDTGPTTARNSVVEEVVSRDELLGRHISSSMGGMRRFGTGQIPRAVSVPLLPAGMPNQSLSTWHSTSSWRSGSALSRSSSSYRPLGSTWRDWDVHMASSMPAGSRANAFGVVSSSASENAQPFVHGCVPHWGKDATIKVRSALEHELTWMYYRIRRQRDHPLRNSVTHPKANGVPLDFWDLCKPPFTVSSASRVSEAGAGSITGAVYRVQYECGVDYVTERVGLAENSSEGGTFDNKICGVAEVRLLPGFPKERPITVLTWGAPSMFAGNAEPLGPSRAVSPDAWNPLAEMLGIRADDPRMKSVNEAAKRLGTARRGDDFDVAPMRKALLGPHPSLPLLARCEQERDLQQGVQPLLPAARRDSAAAARNVRGANAGERQAGSTKKMRKHRVFTAACGFLEYNG